MFDLPPWRVRALARDGLVSPSRGRRREYRFSFQDLVVVRAAAGLLAEDVPYSRVRRALTNLRAQLPGTRPLTAVRIVADRSNVVVRRGTEVWEPDSGQAVLDFEVAEVSREIAPLARRAAERGRREGEALEAEDWFEIGCDLELGDPAEAQLAYRRALEIDPEHADAHLNLGRLLHGAGDLQAAESHYRHALASRPDDATAAFNLGVALEDMDRLDEAIESYRRAVSIDAHYADAHYNLAGIYERLGRRAEATRHLKLYRNLT